MRNLNLPPASAAWGQGIVDLELILIGMGLLAILFIGYWMVVRVRRWQQEEEAERLSPRQQLEQYQALVDEGLLAPEEFEKLRKRLAPPTTPGSREFD